MFRVHQLLDELEADCTLNEPDYLLIGVGGLFRMGADRFDQLEHCLENVWSAGSPAADPNLHARDDNVSAGYSLTDLGNSERLVEAYQHELQYVTGIGWHVHDGRRWRRDEDGAAIRRAKLAVRQIYTEAASVDDEDARKALVGHAIRSEAERRLSAMVSLAQSDERVIVRPDQLDADPMCLNVQNGTLDLRTGRLRPHASRDLVSMIAGAEYHPDARHPAFDRFLNSSFEGDPELEAFVRRAMGYTLTGDTSEEVLFFLHGPTSTGKSTFVEAGKAALGEYAATADFEAFIAGPASGGARSDIARLRGRRFAIGVEVDDGKRLAEGLLKQLTGGDTITTRFMYRDYFEYRPQFKLWLAANHRPRVNAEDDAMWRRIIQIPFTSQVPPDERDPRLKRTLTTDPAARAAVLAWAVRGCIEWQQHGLQIPERVRKYTAEYRNENDPLADWIAGLTLDPAATTTAKDLRADYEAWCAVNGDRPVGSKAFGAALRLHGCNPGRTGSRRYWQGIAMTSNDGRFRESPLKEKRI